MTAQIRVRVVCAWCDKFLRGEPDSGLVSHGICEPCFHRMMASCKKQEMEDTPDHLDNQELGGEG